jgi:tol-pal system protein YbgF
MRIWALLLFVSSTACWVSSERGRKMEDRLQRLEDENDRVTKQIEEQRAVIRDRVAKIDKKIEELNAVAHRTGADLAVNQDKLQEQFAQVKGLLEEDRHRLEQLDATLAAIKTETDGRFAALKGAGALEEYEAKKKLELLKPPSDKAGLLALAQKQEEAGERVVARDLYQEYVKRWPADPRSADANFRIGELFFGDKRYREAILAYAKTAEDFPRSDKAPDALYRIGESMLVLDLKDDAKSAFEKVVERYPKSGAATKAKARLTELSSRTPKRKR